MRLTKLFSIMLLIQLFLSGCIPSHQQENNQEQQPSRERIIQEEKEPENKPEEKKMNLQLDIKEELFHSVADWLDDETVLYIVNNAEGSEVHTYNLYTGDTKLFYKSEDPIVQMKANEDNSLFFVQTSPSSYKAKLLFLNREGVIQYQTEIESYELSFTWNQVNPDQLFVTSFNEDWSYSTKIIDIHNHQITENPVDIPFIQWINNNQVSYIKWDQEEPSLTAPLYMHNLKDHTETLLSEQVVANTNFPNLITTIELIDENGTAVVRFYDSDRQEKLAEMSTRLVALYSDWSIPYYDLDKEENLFYIFEVNEEKNDFTLVSFSPDTSEKKVIFESIENFQIKLSPNGKLALYGPRFEKILDLNNQLVEELITLN
ncbi:hypothetical protein [Metabacillus halosaccharovorans]|uniref:YqgU-like beta propeller domain-containing protein n=1 Tax=Metabacillus halosaccharovorans TaxID=930124 RepID=UPI0020405E8C|nr:hypothetical protein [Metabacillus halosaccharovorans]MCM3442138.1 hypothetical protein [Metabacillus halosaccharovorans]